MILSLVTPGSRTSGARQHRGGGAGAEQRQHCPSRRLIVLLRCWNTIRLDQICFDDVLIPHEGFGGTGQRHAPFFQHVGMVCDAQRLPRVLLDQENSHVLTVDVPDQIEDLLHQKWCEAERGFVEKNDARARHHARPMATICLLPARQRRGNLAATLNEAGEKPMGQARGQNATSAHGRNRRRPCAGSPRPSALRRADALPGRAPARAAMIASVDNPMMLSPSSRIDPDIWHGTLLVTQPSNVDFPAPFEPSSDTICPRATESVTSVSAAMAP